MSSISITSKFSGSAPILGAMLAQVTSRLKSFYAEHSSPSYTFRVIPLDRSVYPELYASAVVLAAYLTDKPEQNVAFHTLLIEASADTPTPLTEKIGGEDVTIRRTISEAYDQVMVNTITSAVQREFPTSKLGNAAAEVLPRDFDLEYPQALYALATNAAFAVSQALQEADADFKDVDVTQHIHDTSLVASVSLLNTLRTDAVGHPVRSDVVITLRARPRTRLDRPSLAAGSDVTLAQVSGYVDFLEYLPRFVVTALDNMAIATPAMALLALTPLLALREEDVWKEVVPTRHHRVIEGVRNTGLMLSLDVPECGPSTWQTSVFAAAAEGNPRAIEVVLQAANQLTGGNFAQHFHGSVATDESNRIHLGHYLGGRGERRDLREIDTLTVQEGLAMGDPVAFQAWKNSWLDTTVPLPVRLAQREEVFQRFTDDVVYTGYGRRVTFTAAFTEALAYGLRDGGVSIKMEGDLSKKYKQKYNPR